MSWPEAEPGGYTAPITNFSRDERFIDIQMSSCGPQSIVVRCWKARSSRTQTATPPPCAVRSSRSGEWNPFIVDSAIVILSKVSSVSVTIATSTLRAWRVCSNSPNFEASPNTFVIKMLRERGEVEMRAVVVECALGLLAGVIARSWSCALLSIIRIAGLLFSECLVWHISAGRWLRIFYVWLATGDGGAAGPRLAIPSLFFLARLLLEFPWSSIHTSGPEVAATNILTGSVVDGDASSPTAEFSLFSAEDRAIENFWSIDTDFFQAFCDVFSELFLARVLFKVANLQHRFLSRWLGFQHEGPEFVVIVIRRNGFHGGWFWQCCFNRTWGSGALFALNMRGD